MSNKLLWVLLVTAIGLMMLGLFWLDVPIAVFFAHFARPLQPLGAHLGSGVLVSGEATVAIGLALYRIIVGRLTGWAKVTVIACAVSLSAFALNEVVLKVIFGMPGPDEMLAGAPHVFNFLQGNWRSSFPSGHMVLAAGFTATFIGQDRRLLYSLMAGTAFAAVLLVVGEWHFLSDVIAGAMLGCTAGATAATLWTRHLADVGR